MLKYKITLPNLGADSKELEITEFEVADVPHYEAREGHYNVTSIIEDEYTYTFTAKNIYSIQAGSHLIGMSTVRIANDNNTAINTYYHYDDLIVEKASAADNTFVVYIKKELELNVQNINICTRYHKIYFYEGQWHIAEVIKDDIIDKYTDGILTTEGIYGKEGRYIDIKMAACGQNIEDGDYVNTWNVFYYENSSWKEISLTDEEYESYKVSNTLSFNKFHVYDKEKRTVVELDTDKEYYTKETYIYFNVYPTHYFIQPLEETETEDSDGKLMNKLDEKFYRTIIKSVDYPKVTLSYETSTSGVLETKKIEDIECHIDSDTQLSFNYDILSEADQATIEKRLFTDGYDVDLDMEALDQEGNSGAFVITRENRMYDMDYCAFSITYDMTVNTIKIPISQKFETDMYHNDALQTNFIDDAKANAINPIIDMEKDVYIPAIHSENNNIDGEYNHINAEYDECRKIIFNLHFREHRDNSENGEEWQCDKTCYWNGTRVVCRKYKNSKGETIDQKTYETYSKEEKNKCSEYNVLDLLGRVYQYQSEEVNPSTNHKENKYEYFSYFGNPPLDTDDNYDKPYIDNTNLGEYDIESLSNYKDLRTSRNNLYEYQSDLLSYLGFTNDDIKYQKSKLKKSFLRLSFYDSDNIGNQNLLHTATIFIDSGNLFAKYIKNIDTDESYQVNETIPQSNEGGCGEWNGYGDGEVIESNVYSKLSSTSQKVCQIYGEPTAIIGSSKDEAIAFTTYDKNGVRVNREPMRSKAIDVKRGDLGDNISDLEDLRLSCQFEVTDKYSSDRSSEGFYFYTYKSNDNGVYPSEIYMRVDFCHAGYGRTIPFMMPYIRKGEAETVKRYKDRTKKIKTFDDICYDWSGIDYDVSSETFKDEDKIGYGSIRYIKYAFIKWKYRYDKKTQKHIYYLDPDVYGDSVTNTNGHGKNIILNLYEGKIS